LLSWDQITIFRHQKKFRPQLVHLAHTAGLTHFWLDDETIQWGMSRQRLHHASASAFSPSQVLENGIAHVFGEPLWPDERPLRCPLPSVVVHMVDSFWPLYESRLKIVHGIRSEWQRIGGIT
jgi:hypothetical protein